VVLGGELERAAQRIDAPDQLAVDSLHAPTLAPRRDGARSSEARTPRRDPRPRRDSVGAVGEPELVVTEVEHVPLVDALVVDAHALVVDAVRRPEVLDVERPVATDDGRVLARDVAVLDRQVGRLAAATDDELVLGHGVALP